MGKKLYYLDESEKRRILELHNQNKKNQVNEQGLLTYYGATVPTTVSDFALGPLSTVYRTYKTVTHASTRDEKAEKIDAYCKAETTGSPNKNALSVFKFATTGTGYMSDDTYNKVLTNLKSLSGKDYCATSNSFAKEMKTPLINKFLEYIYSLDSEIEVLDTILKLIPPPPPESLESPNSSEESTLSPDVSGENESYEQPQTPDADNQQTSQGQSSNNVVQQSTQPQQQIKISADYRVLTPQKIAELRKKIGSTSTGNQLTQDDLNKIMEKLKEKSG